jgi:dihydrofolate reductase
MTISLIAAVAQNRAIGKNNQLLWHLPEDMRYFRDTTRGKSVNMGRKTWESLPDKFRPLPGRRNIVVTHDRHYVADGAVLAHSLEEAVDVAGEDSETFVIGGAELYQQALPAAQRLYLTEVAQAYEGDVFFPEYPVTEWQEASRAEQRSKSGIEFAFVVYQRR